MAESRKSTDTQLSDEHENGSRGVGGAVLSATQDAAGAARMTAERAAARLPDAVAGVQVAATETQRRLEEMPNQALVIGTSFSLGLAVGLFISGANRLLVTLALAPAVAMAMTISGRQQSGSRRVGGRAGSGEQGA